MLPPSVCLEASGSHSATTGQGRKVARRCTNGIKDIVRRAPGQLPAPAQGRVSTQAKTAVPNRNARHDANQVPREQLGVLGRASVLLSSRFATCVCVCSCLLQFLLFIVSASRSSRNRQNTAPHKGCKQIKHDLVCVQSCHHFAQCEARYKTEAASAAVSLVSCACVKCVKRQVRVFHPCHVRA